MAKISQLHKSLLLQLLALILLFFSSASFAQGPFTQRNDLICGAGKNLELGCDDIRNREIKPSLKKPWSAIGRINYAGFRKRHHCTGTLISNKHVITAAHCLFSIRTRRWLPPNSINFVAGFSREEFVGHARTKRYFVSPDNDPLSRRFNYEPEHDWAILELDKPLGKTAGYFKVLDKSKSIKVDESLRSSKVSVAGYAGLRRFILTSESNCNIKNINRNFDALTHDCPTMRGDSGGPIIIITETGPTVIGVSSSVSVRNGQVVSTTTLIDQKLIQKYVPGFPDN